MKKSIFLQSQVATMFLDQSVLDFILSLRSAALTPVMLFFTWLGSIQGVLVVSALVLLVLSIMRQWRSLLFYTVSVAGSALVMSILKLLIARPRPPAALALATEVSSAFPSGHAMVALALYGACMLILLQSNLKRSLVFLCSCVFVFLCLAIGFSRLYLGVHWLSDVLGGYLLGALWLWMSYHGSRLAGRDDT